ncbi:MAG: glutamate-cysteine ligase family protein [Cyclobacteriaceae bacterium]
MFQAYGVELEYMIVRKNDLQVLPISDTLMERVAGHITDEIKRKDISWSNELVLHVIELKTAVPSPGLDGLQHKFAEAIKEINELLEEDEAMLMPTAMHPLMNPDRDMKLWPHGNREIYAAYDRIFNCKGHGWANLQSVHLNLPFHGDAEFARLHTAIRLLLPILPALAASSPIMEGHLSGLRDTRLQVYKSNQAVVPQIAGKVIPEPVQSAEEYHKVIFQPMYDAIASDDPDGILQEEWLNSRGAIARFDRNAIEIRVLDIQECPAADLAILQVICAVLKELCSENISAYETQLKPETGQLLTALNSVIEKGEDAIITERNFLNALGLKSKPVKAGNVWKELLNKVSITAEAREKLDFILTHGTLSARITRALQEGSGEAAIRKVYGHLAGCLKHNKMFLPESV